MRICQFLSYLIPKERLRKKLAFLLIFLLMGYIMPAQKIIRVYPKVIDSILLNPGIGFMTFQRFNGDTLNQVGWTEGFPISYQKFNGSLKNKDYPETTIAYFRIYWQYLEPEPGKYNWRLIDKALKTAYERHQSLMLRVAPYGYPLNKKDDVPAWYRSMVGNEENNLLRRWRVDPEKPLYLKYFGGLISAMGKRYDGNPHLLAVDLSIVGYWGEGEGSADLKKGTREALVDAYTDNFKKTPLIMQLTDRRTNQYALSQANVGWRGDCLGNMGGKSSLTSSSSSEMLDEYPEDIVEYGMQDAWKKVPVSMEVCGTMQLWKKHGVDIQYVINQSLKWHISSFNAKSSPVPKEWQPVVNQWLKKMGYRFALRRFTYPDSIESNSMLHFTSWWENQGVAPCYNKNFRLAIRLETKSKSITVITNADITQWLPGDYVYNDAVYVPFNMPAGEYELQIGIVDRETHKPVINIAIEGRDAQGWYSLGKIHVD
ncbi:MAG: DUF4832 domain-containing protein [Chitinophagaceae bacterium]|nr:MAG: DUF4832 domain-containing protein [Chitinophagaceae bacterium]